MDENLRNLIELVDSMSTSISIRTSEVDFVQDELRIVFVSVDKDDKYKCLSNAQTLVTFHGPNGKTKSITVIGYHRIGDEISKAIKSLDFEVLLITDRYLGRIMTIDHRKNIEDQIVNDKRTEVTNLFLLCGEIFYITPEELYKPSVEGRLHAYMIGKSGAVLCSIFQEFKEDLECFH